MQPLRFKQEFFYLKTREFLLKPMVHQHGKGEILCFRGKKVYPE
jgi:hypothetical protein